MEPLLMKFCTQEEYYVIGKYFDRNKFYQIQN